MRKSQERLSKWTGLENELKYKSRLNNIIL